MKKIQIDDEFYGREKISRILLKIAPPVMLAQLIQSLYNIADSFFVGKYSDNSLTALSVIYPIQLIIVALAVGTGVGVNTYMARKYAQHDEESSRKAAGTGTVLAVLSWAVFTVISLLIMRPYVLTSAKSEAAINDAVTYGIIVCAGSLFSFLEGNWTKVHQAHGNMTLPMIAQVSGAVTNIILDPLLIFGFAFIPAMGVAGAAIATVAGQAVAAIITGISGCKKPPKISEMPHYAARIYHYGYSSIIMQTLFTVYIVALNVILASFSDEAVTVLGLYYKLQSFFFIPLFGLQTCIVPVLSYNFTCSRIDRCRQVMRDTLIISCLFMLIGIVVFVFFPDFAIDIFSKNPKVHDIGRKAFPIIGSSFICAAFSLTFPVFFQAIGYGKTSMLLSCTRQLFCLIPIFYLFSLVGLDYCWLSFPISETIAGSIGLILYIIMIKKQKKRLNATALSI